MGDMTLSEAAAECGKWGNLIRALSKVQESAQTLVGIEQSVTERKALVESLGKQIADARTSVAEANEKAASISAAASANADAAIAQATEQASKIAEGAKVAADAAAADRDYARGQADSARSDLAVIQRDIVNASADLSRLQEKIEAARAAAKTLIEG